MTSVRVMGWPDCLNARDLGGLPTADGHRIATGALIRSDAHYRLTPAGIAAVRACGVRRIVDLRSVGECAARPSPFGGSAIYHNAPVIDVVDGPWAVSTAVARTLEEMYRAMLDRFPGMFGAALTAVASAPVGPVVVHCHAGKDRTGLVVALALTVAGAEPAALAEDYAVSSSFLGQLYAEELARVPDPAARTRMRVFHTSPPEAILGAIEYLRDRHGGVEAYLRYGGMTDAALEALRTRLRAD